MDQQNTEQTQVDSTKLVTGKIKFGINGIGLPAPRVLSAVCGGIRNFCAGLIVAFQAAPAEVMSTHTAGVISFWLGITILACSSINLATGVDTQAK